MGPNNHNAYRCQIWWSFKKLTKICHISFCWLTNYNIYYVQKIDVFFFILNTSVAAPWAGSKRRPLHTPPPLTTHLVWVVFNTHDVSGVESTTETTCVLNTAQRTKRWPNILYSWLRASWTKLHSCPTRCDCIQYIIYITVGSSTCFGCWQPSSGARTAVITACDTGQL